MLDVATDRERHPWLRAYPQAIDWHAEIAVRPITALLDDGVARFANRPCTDFLGRRLTYAQIGALADRAAKGFQALGVGPGVKVGLFLPNVPQFIVCFFAILKAGGTVVNFNPLSAEAEVARQIDDSETDLIVTLDVKVLHDKAQKMLHATRLRRLVVCRMGEALPFPKNTLFALLKSKQIARIPDDDRHVPFSRLIANDGRYRPVVLNPADLAVLQYTGGTTGAPKGAMLSHANVYANVVQSASWFQGARPGQEVLLGVLPLFHCFAMTVIMNLGVYLGAEIVLLPRFDIDELLRTIARKRPSLFPAVPTIYTAINNHKQRDRYDLSSINMCLSGGAPLPLEVQQTFEKLTGCHLVEGYGLTESAPVAICNPLDGHSKAGSIGLPLPGTIAEIISLEDRRTPLPLGERGEICLRGPQVMQGYWHRDEETRETIVDGRLHTGDVGYMDEDGYIFIVDRIKDVILCGGYNVYPRNVEEAIYQHPAVAECIVLGVPDAYRGQTVKAFVRLREGRHLGLKDLTAFLADKLSPIEMPKELEIRADLPRTMIGKLSRKDLMEEEEAKRAAGG